MVDDKVLLRRKKDDKEQEVVVVRETAWSGHKSASVDGIICFTRKFGTTWSSMSDGELWEEAGQS